MRYIFLPLDLPHLCILNVSFDILLCWIKKLQTLGNSERREEYDKVRLCCCYLSGGEITKLFFLSVITLYSCAIEVQIMLIMTVMMQRGSDVLTNPISRIRSTRFFLRYTILFPICLICLCD